MKFFNRFMIMAFVVGISMASAHQPAGKIYSAPQFPLHAVPFIDGDTSDWEVFDPQLFGQSVEAGDMKETVRGNDFEPSDFNAQSLWAWNEETNRVYAYAFVNDDVLHNKREDSAFYNFDDDWAFIIDADHSGGDMFNGDWNNLPEDERRDLFYTTGQYWQFHVPPLNGYWIFKYIEATDWETTGRELPFPEFAEAGWSRTGETGGPGTYTYEIKLTPWEVWNWDGPDQSTIVDLEVGMIIHVGAVSRDYDLSEGLEEMYTFPAQSFVFFDASLMADMELLEVDNSLFPTAVEEDTWGRIKAHFLLEE